MISDAMNILLVGCSQADIHMHFVHAVCNKGTNAWANFRWVRPTIDDSRSLDGFAIVDDQ